MWRWTGIYTGTKEPRSQYGESPLPKNKTEFRMKAAQTLGWLLKAASPQEVEAMQGLMDQAPEAIRIPLMPTRVADPSFPTTLMLLETESGEEPLDQWLQEARWGLEDGLGQEMPGAEISLESMIRLLTGA